jgi:DNA uptake protein ComE-like DNA-binding protein
LTKFIINDIIVKNQNYRKTNKNMGNKWQYLPLGLILVGVISLTSCGNESNNNSNSSSSGNKTEQTTTKNQPEHSDNMGHGSGKKININSAILSELDKLEAKLGVPALSNKIQASRPYTKSEDLVSKNVISQEQFEKIKDLITIEDIALTGEAKDIDFMIKMGLMKGHLIVAKELLDLQKPKEAEPHIGHPVEEIYIDVEEQLKERNIKEFKSSLVSLDDLVKSKPKDGQIATNFQASMQAIDTAIQTLPENERNSPAFVLKVINGLLDAANSEYGAAVSNGKISAAIEYQDSRGFVTYVETLYKSIADKMDKSHPKEHKIINESITELKTNWTGVIPPEKIVKTPVQVSELIKKIETETSKIN